MIKLRPRSASGRRNWRLTTRELRGQKAARSFSSWFRLDVWKKIRSVRVTFVPEAGPAPSLCGTCGPPRLVIGVMIFVTRSTRLTQPFVCPQITVRFCVSGTRSRGQTPRTIKPLMFVSGQMSPRSSLNFRARVLIQPFLILRVTGRLVKLVFPKISTGWRLPNRRKILFVMRSPSVSLLNVSRTCWRCWRRVIIVVIKFRRSSRPFLTVRPFKSSLLPRLVVLKRRRRLNNVKTHRCRRCGKELTSSRNRRGRPTRRFFVRLSRLKFRWNQTRTRGSRSLPFGNPLIQIVNL